MVDRVPGGVPGRPEGLEVSEERGHVKPIGTDDSATGHQRRQERCEQAVPVEHRHDVETSVGRAQVVLAFHGLGEGQEVTLPTRYELRLAGASRGHEDDRDVFGCIPAARLGLPEGVGAQFERARGVRNVDDEIDDPDPAGRGRPPGRQPAGCRKDERGRAQSIEIP